MSDDESLRAETERQGTEAVPGPTAVGVDLGGTRLRAARIDGQGRILAILRRPTEGAGGPGAVTAQIAALVEALRDPTTQAVGIGVPGSVDRAGGTVINLPALAGWIDVPLAAQLAGATGLPCRIENDAKAAALGEWRAGAGRGQENFVCVTIGTGIGVAAVVDGRLLRGSGGLAGEIGHTRVTDHPAVCACGLTGCWQAVASGAALDARARDLAGADPSGGVARAAGDRGATAVDVTSAARGGDAPALRLLAEHAVLIGYGLANLSHAYAPDRIVVGGGVSALLDLMRPEIERILRERLLPGFRRPAVTRAELGDDAGVVGAASQALGNLPS